ncbi:MAG TPA: sulfite exporter TauE/SafE family protein [Gaiellaceae bacterium]|nr:sulfite exporter TauE/SafE family protein [Gaiellaceae bacterium]
MIAASDGLSTSAASKVSEPTAIRYGPVARLLAIGLAAGVFSALFGVGGGIVIVPLLVTVAGFDGRRATGTSLAAIGITAGAGALVYGLHGDVKVGSAALIGLPAALGAVLGVALQQRLPTRTLTIGFSLFLTAVGIRLLV